MRKIKSKEKKKKRRRKLIGVFSYSVMYNITNKCSVFCCVCIKCSKKIMSIEHQNAWPVYVHLKIIIIIIMIAKCTDLHISVLFVLSIYI